MAGLAAAPGKGLARFGVFKGPGAAAQERAFAQQRLEERACKALASGGAVSGSAKSPLGSTKSPAGYAKSPANTGGSSKKIAEADAYDDSFGPAVVREDDDKELQQEGQEALKRLTAIMTRMEDQFDRAVTHLEKEQATQHNQLASATARVEAAQQIVLASQANLREKLVELSVRSSAMQSHSETSAAEDICAFQTQPDMD